MLLATWQGWVSQQMPGEFLQQFCRLVGKDWQDVFTRLGWPQLQCGKCHRVGTRQASLEVIGSKRNCILKWCKPKCWWWWWWWWVI